MERVKVMRAGLVVSAAGVLIAAVIQAAPAVRVGGEARSLQERIDAAAPGDTIYVEGGTYRENIVIDKPLTLSGEDGATIDGGGSGDVVTVRADGVTLSGFTIRGSGRSLSQEPAAVKVENTHGLTLRSLRIRDSHFGIHVTGSHHATIAYNDVDAGAGTPVERRGHGIYLWETGMSVVMENTIRHAADGIHLEFSEGDRIARNTVTDSRYALHFMYSDDQVVRGNTFRHNLSGAVLMFSHNLLLKDNEIASNRRGATGAGILLKDVDDIFAEGNRVLRNKVGLAADGSPQSAGATAVVMRNLFALNDTGIGLMPTAPITFVENAMVENTVQVRALSGSLGGHEAAPPWGAGGRGAGAGHAGHGADAPAPGAAAPAGGSRSAAWNVNGRGNYWSDYRGYDADGDGVGDRPYEPKPPFAGALSDNDTLRAFQFTLAQQALDAGAEMFPVYRYRPVIEDSAPLMQAPGPALPRDGRLNQGLLAVSALLLVLAGALLHAVLDIDPVAPLRRALGVAGRRLSGEGSV